MTRTRSLPASVLAVLLSTLLLPPADADKITLKDGRVIDGKIIKQDADSIKVQMPRAAITIARADIVDIKAEKSPVEIAEEKLLTLAPDQAAKYLDAGRWFIDEQKMDEIGLRLVNLAMVLDGEHNYVPGQLYLGDYWKKKRDPQKAAQCYMRAMQSDPNNPTCKARFNDVKSSVQDVRVASEQGITTGLDYLKAGDYEHAAQALTNGLSSPLRARCEEILGVPVKDLIAFAESKLICKGCNGAKQVTCDICKGTGALDCVACAGQGSRKVTSLNSVKYQKCTNCDGWGNILCERCKATRSVTANSVPSTPSASSWVKPASTIKGGKIQCRVCKGKDPKPAAAPPMDRVERCAMFLQRKSTGKLTLLEQAETRLVRVGAAGQVEEAEALRAAPVYWGGKWVSVEERRAADPTFKYQEAATADDIAERRKGALAFGPEGAAPEAFQEKIRQTFGAGSTASAGSRPIYFTDFAFKTPDGDQVGSGPFTEIEAGANRLRPCLVQVGQKFSTYRVTLDGPDGPGLPLESKVELAMMAGTPGTSARIYYQVVDARETTVPSPTGDRDLSATRLTTRLVLVDFLDAAGKVIKSSK